MGLFLFLRTEIVFINFEKSKIINNQATLGRTERLKSRKLIELLFRDGKSITAFPLRITYARPLVGTATLQAGFSASSRNFKKAADRNRIKRLLREAYRKQKPALEKQVGLTGGKMILFIIYTGKEVPDLKLVEEKMKLLIDKLINQTN